jgi:hypothetical protein
MIEARGPDQVRGNLDQPEHVMNRIPFKANQSRRVGVRHLLSAALAALGMSATMAQEATPDTWMKVSSEKSRAQVTQEVVAARANGDFDVARQYDIVDRHYRPTLSRAEVLADLQVWQRAGLQAFNRGEASPDTSSVEYRRAYARYAELRTSAEFAALVQSIARERGETVVVTTQGTVNER